MVPVAVITVPMRALRAWEVKDGETTQAGFCLRLLTRTWQV